MAKMAGKFKSIENLKITGLLSEYPALKIYSAWKACAGPIFLKCVQFHGIVKFEEQVVLRISIDDPLWLQEFQYQKQTLLKRFQNELKRFNFSTKDLPTDILILSGRSLPIKTGHTQLSRYKK